MSARHLPVPLLAVVLVSLCGPGCRTEPTSMYVGVQFDPSIAITQLTFVLVDQDGTALPEVTRPEEEAQSLASPQSIRLLLPDALDGTLVTVTVLGRRGGEERARVTKAVTVRRGEEVPLEVSLSEPTMLGCGPSHPCAAGLRCESGLCVCDATSCPAGCCDESGCRRRSMDACGAAGATCFTCDARSDNCTGDGACACGNGDVCEVGQRCLGGTCVCDGQSCDGCCDNGVCRPGDAPTSCGAAGGACEACSPGDDCFGGACANCNAGSCDTCCSGSMCLPAGLSSCGILGNACVDCGEFRADNCSPTGECRCGSGPTCGDGQQCVEGACACTAESCTGCCSGNTCVTGGESSACGFGGAECQTCDNGNRCSSGECRCGNGPECSGVCVSGACVK